MKTAQQYVAVCPDGGAVTVADDRVVEIVLSLLSPQQRVSLPKPLYRQTARSGWGQHRWDPKVAVRWSDPWRRMGEFKDGWWSQGVGARGTNPGALMFPPCLW